MDAAKEGPAERRRGRSRRQSSSRYLLPPGLVAPQRPSFLRQSDEHLFSFVPLVHRRISIEVVFEEELCELAVLVVDPL